ncbi:arabinofuranosyltransferase [Amycolatopsis minnesotensis]|uniref:arabinofuranosyltransferase n=1 Tax=Amycolatopsis minnesotensis TaxID=337894 RepID=UPI003CD0570D
MRRTQAATDRLIAGWANPLADFAGRDAELRNWAGISDPGALVRALENSRFTALHTRRHRPPTQSSPATPQLGS